MKFKLDTHHVAPYCFKTLIPKSPFLKLHIMLLQKFGEFHGTVQLSCFLDLLQSYALCNKSQNFLKYIVKDKDEFLHG